MCLFFDQRHRISSLDFDYRFAKCVELPLQNFARRGQVDGLTRPSPQGHTAAMRGVGVAGACLRPSCCRPTATNQNCINFNNSGPRTMNEGRERV